MGMIEEVRKLILRLGDIGEPSYRIYYSQDALACERYWRRFYGVPYAYLGVISGMCRPDRQIYIDFDCHGDPMTPSKERPYGDLLGVYWPDALWAQGKWAIYTSERTNYPHGEFVPLHDEINLIAKCCPKEWKEEIVGIEGIPD